MYYCKSPWLRTVFKHRFHNGAVILDTPTSLPNGTPVSIEPLPSDLTPTTHPRNSAAAILATLAQLPPMSPEAQADWDAALEDLREYKQASIAFETDYLKRHPPRDKPPLHAGVERREQ